jgi:hypothetical protein
MSVMYGFRYEVLLPLLLALVLIVGIPLSVILRRGGLAWWKILPLVALSSLGVLVLSVIASTVVTVWLPSKNSPSPEEVNSLGTTALGVEAASDPGMALKNRDGDAEPWA